MGRTKAIDDGFEEDTEEEINEETDEEIDEEIVEDAEDETEEETEPEQPIVRRSKRQEVKLKKRAEALEKRNAMLGISTPDGSESSDSGIDDEQLEHIFTSHVGRRIPEPGNKDRKGGHGKYIIVGARKADLTGPSKRWRSAAVDSGE